MSRSLQDSVVHWTASTLTAHNACSTHLQGILLSHSPSVSMSLLHVDPYSVYIVILPSKRSYKVCYCVWPTRRRRLNAERSVPEDAETKTQSIDSTGWLHSLTKDSLASLLVDSSMTLSLLCGHSELEKYDFNSPVHSFKINTYNQVFELFWRFPLILFHISSAHSRGQISLDRLFI